MNSLSNEVSELNLNFNFQESNNELMCEQYLNQLSQLQNKYVIEKSLRLKNKFNVKWLTFEIKSLMNRRDFVKKKFNNLKAKGILNNNLFQEYKNLRNAVVRLIRK